MFGLGRRLWAMGTPKPPPPRSGVENNIIEGAPDLAPAVVEDIATRTRRPPRSGPGSRSRLFARPPRARKRAHRSRWRRRSAAGCRRCWVSCAPPAPAHPAAPPPRRTSSTRPEWRMTPRWRGRVRPGHRHRGGSAWSGQLPAQDREEAGDPVQCRPQAAESTSTHEQAADRDRRASSAPHRRGGPGLMRAPNCRREPGCDELVSPVGGGALVGAFLLWCAARLAARWADPQTARDPLTYGAGFLPFAPPASRRDPARVRAAAARSGYATDVARSSSIPSRRLLNVRVARADDSGAR